MKLFHKKKQGNIFPHFCNTSMLYADILLITYLMTVGVPRSSNIYGTHTAPNLTAACVQHPFPFFWQILDSIVPV